MSKLSQGILQSRTKKQAKLRNKYSKVELLITDEIPIVSSKLLYQVHKLLNEIFSPNQDIPFDEN